MSRKPLILPVSLLFAVLALDVSAKPPVKPAKPAVIGVIHGHGKVPSDEENVSASQISINAWLDSEGVAHGMVSWTGDDEFVPGSPKDKGGPSDPWHIEVTSIHFYSARRAEVCGVVVHSPIKSEIGSEGCQEFKDNRGTGKADTIDDAPIVAGNIIIAK